MPGPQRKGGIIQIQVAGVTLDAKGAFTFNLGMPKRETIMGVDGVHGYKETPQVAFIEGEITDRGTLSLADLVGSDGVTVTLTHGNGKVIVLRDGWFASEGDGETDEGAIKVRWESRSQAQEIT